MTGDFGTIGIAVLACVVLVIIGFMVGGLIRRKREDAEWSKSLNSCVRASEMASKSRFQHITDTDKDHVFSPKDLGFEDRDDDPDPDGDEDDDSWDEEEDEEEGPPVPEWRAAHYYCNDCGGEFRMPEGIVPKKCPFCDADTIMDMDEDEPDVEEDSLLFVCPHCKREFHMRDGETPDMCPFCGAERGACDDWAVYVGELALLQGYWVCPECGQEFRLDNDTEAPKFCPSCEAEFATADKYPVPEEDEPSTYTCRACGGTVVLLDSDRPVHCPHCGRRGTLEEVADKSED